MKGRQKEDIDILDIVTLHDVNMPERSCAPAAVVSRERLTDPPWEAGTLRPGHPPDFSCARTPHSLIPGPVSLYQGAAGEQRARNSPYCSSIVLFTWDDVKLVPAPAIELNVVLKPAHAVDRAPQTAFSGLMQILMVSQVPSFPSYWTWLNADMYKDGRTKTASKGAAHQT